MIPEAVISCYAVAGIGAVLVPLFSGFASTAIAARLRDAEVKAVVVADARSAAAAASTWPPNGARRYRKPRRCMR